MGAEVGDRQWLILGAGEEEVAHRHMHGTGEVLQLFKRGSRVTRLPLRELGETVCQLVSRYHTGALTRPAQHLGSDGDARHLD